MAVKQPSAAALERQLRQNRSARQFLDHRHPIYKANSARWLLNEARYAGGDDVLEELEAFDWETDLTPTGHLQKRKNQAIYVNFPELFCSVISGHLLKFAPKPGTNLDFGGLGKVGQAKQSTSRADLIYQNPDGPGNTGSAWDLWWAETLERAIVTGHRWIYVEAPTEAPLTQAREVQGLRPYLCEYSPLDVTDWLYDQAGVLQYAVIRYWQYDPARLYGLETNLETLQGFSYLLLVAEGYTGLDDRVASEVYSTGGWWKFTPEKDPIDQGDWADTLGQIPLYPLYYERFKGTRKRPAMSRSGVTELGQAAIASMNVGSAANFNAVDVGQGLTWLMGVDEDSMELAVGQIKRGDRFIGVPPNQDTEVTPTIAMSGQNSVQSTVFDSRERAIWAAAVQLGINEAAGPSQAPSAAGGPGNTGASQQAKFGTSQAPRISRVAANLEVAQQIAIDLLHLRFGVGPSTGSVVWPKKFDLVELVDRIKQFFEVQRLSGISSETVDAQAMVQVAKDKGLLGDGVDTQAILAEFTRSAKVKQQAAQAQAQASRMAPPQSLSTRNKQKGRMAGRKQDRRQAGRNTGGLR